MLAFLRRLYGDPPKAQSAPLREPTFAVMETDGLWFLALYIEYTDLWAEDFQGAKWAWYKWRESFPTKDAAEERGRLEIQKAKARLSDARAKNAFASLLPET